MRRRRLLVLATLAAMAWLFLLVTPGGVSDATIAALQPGLHRAQVEAIFRGPPVEAVTSRGKVGDFFQFWSNADPAVQQAEGHKDYQIYFWESKGLFDHRTVAVVFDEGRVVCRYTSTYPEGLWHDFRKWVPSLW